MLIIGLVVFMGLFLYNLYKVWIDDEEWRYVDFLIMVIGIVIMIIVAYYIITKN